MLCKRLLLLFLWLLLLTALTFVSTLVVLVALIHPPLPLLRFPRSMLTFVPCTPPPCPTLDILSGLRVLWELFVNFCMLIIPSLNALREVWHCGRGSHPNCPAISSAPSPSSFRIQGNGHFSLVAEWMQIWGHQICFIHEGLDKCPLFCSLGSSVR